MCRESTKSSGTKIAPLNIIDLGFLPRSWDSFKTWMEVFDYNTLYLPNIKIENRASTFDWKQIFQFRTEFQSKYFPNITQAFCKY